MRVKVRHNNSDDDDVSWDTIYMRSNEDTKRMRNSENGRINGFKVKMEVKDG